MNTPVLAPFNMARTLGALGLAGSLAAGSSWAGPQVGETVGTPNSSTVTIQARVVSSTPVVAQIAVPTQVCYDEMRHVPARTSGAGALLGAIAGGAAGNAVGKGAGKALATGLGIFGGAVLGDRIEHQGRQGSTSTVRRCEAQNSYENRVVAYSVVYEWGGQRYSTQMGQEPGSTIPVSLTFTPLVPGAPEQPGAVSRTAYDNEPAYDDMPSERRRRHWH